MNLVFLKRNVCVISMLLIVSGSTLADNYELKQQLISTAGLNGSSSSYTVVATLAQVAVGAGNSTNYLNENGYWPSTKALGACCGFYVSGFTGNADCLPDGKRNLSDINRLISFVYNNGPDLCCHENGNVDGDVDGKVNLSDINRLMDHVYYSKAETELCQ